MDAPSVLVAPHAALYPSWPFGSQEEDLEPTLEPNLGHRIRENLLADLESIIPDYVDLAVPDARRDAAVARYRRLKELAELLNELESSRLVGHLEDRGPRWWLLGVGLLLAAALVTLYLVHT